MAETPVRIPVDDGQISLEGLLEEGKTGRNIILCHPHPSYGGDMENNVVRAVQRTFAGLGWGTLRFNFRGTGASGGKQADGKKDGLDLIDVSQFLKARSPGLIGFAAYSYGAWAVMEAIRIGLLVDLLILISPPLDFISFEGLGLPDAPVLITIGDRDDFCSLKSMKDWLLASQPRTKAPYLEVLAGVDHFYWGAEGQLSAKIGAFLAAQILNPSSVSDKTRGQSG
jgi:hypothetical protein